MWQEKFRERLPAKASWIMKRRAGVFFKEESIDWRLENNKKIRLSPNSTPWATPWDAANWFGTFPAHNSIVISIILFRDYWCSLKLRNRWTSPHLLDFMPGLNISPPCAYIFELLEFGGYPNQASPSCTFVNLSYTNFRVFQLFCI